MGSVKCRVIFNEDNTDFEVNDYEWKVGTDNYLHINILPYFNSEEPPQWWIDSPIHNQYFRNWNITDTDTIYALNDRIEPFSQEESYTTGVRDDKFPGYGSVYSRTFMENCYRDCHNLVHARESGLLPNFKGTSARSTWYCFSNTYRNCYNLTHIDFEIEKTSGVPSINVNDYTFATDVVDYSYRYSGCHNLDEIPPFMCGSLPNINGYKMCENCRTIESFYSDEDGKYTGNWKFNNVAEMFRNCRNLVDYPTDIEDLDPYQTSDWYSTFRDCRSVEKAYFREGMTNLNSTYAGCVKLVGDIDFDVTSVTDVNFLFDRTTGLARLNIFINGENQNIRDIFFNGGVCPLLAGHPAWNVTNLYTEGYYNADLYNIYVYVSDPLPDWPKVKELHLDTYGNSWVPLDTIGYHVVGSSYPMSDADWVNYARGILEREDHTLYEKYDINLYINNYAFVDYRLSDDVVIVYDNLYNTFSNSWISDYSSIFFGQEQNDTIYFDYNINTVDAFRNCKNLTSLLNKPLVMAENMYADCPNLTGVYYWQGDEYRTAVDGLWPGCNFNNIFANHNNEKPIDIYINRYNIYDYSHPQEPSTTAKAWNLAYGLGAEKLIDGFNNNNIRIHWDPEDKGNWFISGVYDTWQYWEDYWVIGDVDWSKVVLTIESEDGQFPGGRPSTDFKVIEVPSCLESDTYSVVTSRLIIDLSSLNTETNLYDVSYLSTPYFNINNCYLRQFSSLALNIKDYKTVIPHENFFKKASLGYMFAECHNLEKVVPREYFTDKLPETYYYYGDCSYMYHNCFNLNDTPVFYEDLCSVMDYMYANCYNLNCDMRVPVGSYTARYMFAECYNLNSNIELYQAPYIEWTGGCCDYMFLNCNGLTKLPKMCNFEHVGDMWNMFDGCTSLSGYYDWSDIDWGAGKTSTEHALFGSTPMNDLLVIRVKKDSGLDRMFRRDYGDWVYDMIDIEGGYLINAMNIVILNDIVDDATIVLAADIPTMVSSLSAYDIAKFAYKE